MLFIDLLDIIYAVLGGIIGASIVSYIDSLNCNDCERGDDCEK